MKDNFKSIIILYAEDDKEDQMLVKEALTESRLANELHFVNNGEELLDYLNRRNAYVHLKDTDLPGLILLDLNMPKIDGREALAIIKSDKKLKSIPICILTTSRAEEDIIQTYDLGVNSYIRKPVSFESLVDIMKALGKYWFEIVELPQ